MKKLQIAALLILSLFFVVSCVSDEDDDEFWNNDQSDTVYGGDSGHDQDSTADTLPEGQTDTASGDTTPDAQDPSHDTADSDSSDTAADDSDRTDSSDSTGDDSDNADTENVDQDNDTDEPADGDDTGPINDDDAESSDDSDLTDDEPADDDDTDTAPSTGLPECSRESGTPCKDSSSSLIWSKKSSDKLSWSSADTYCKNLTDGGLGGWKMPAIYELRTLIKDCTYTQSSGSCMIAEGCLAESCTKNCYACTASSSGEYSKLGDNDTLWSSSGMEGNIYYMWVLGFDAAVFDYAKKASATYKVRCVRK